MKISKKRLTAALMAAGIIGTTLAGCGAQGGTESKAEEPAPASSAAESTVTADTGDKHANIAFFWVATVLDPAVDYEGWVSCRAGITESIVKLNDAYEVEGVLADSWKNVDDTTWEFHIRDGVTFTNGKAVDAAAVKASLERSIEMNTRAADYLKVASMEADGQTLTIKTTEPNGALLNNIVEPVFGIIDVEAEDIENNPIGTGPYMVKEFKSEQSIELVKNENYWDGEVGLDTITVTQIADSNSRVMALQSGETDMTNTIDYVSLSLFEGNDKYNVSTAFGTRVQVAYMNSSEASPLHDVNLRRAISYAVDRDSYVELIGGKVAVGPYTNSLPYHNDKLKNSYTYDTEKANQILDDAGYMDVTGDGIRETPDGKELTLQFIQSADHGSSDSAILAQAIQLNLKDVGINMNIQSVENQSDILASGKFDFYTANDQSAPTGDPQATLELRYTLSDIQGNTNRCKYNNEKLNEVLAQLKTTMDTEGRYELAQQASEVILEDAANLFLTDVSLSMVSSSKLKNAIQPSCDYYFITKDITLA